jgi:hypothetical protein
MSIVESLKPLLLLIVLGGVGYGVYVALNHAPPPEFATIDPQWNRPADSGNPPNAMGNRAPDGGTMNGNAMNSMPPSNGWQQGPAGNTNSGYAGGGDATNGSMPMNGMSGSGAVSSLPFGFGASAARAAASNSMPQNSMPPAAGAPDYQAGNVSAAAAGSFVAPNSGGQNSMPPNMTAPNSSAGSAGGAAAAQADFDGRYSGAMNSAPPNQAMSNQNMPNQAMSNQTVPSQNMAGPAADAQARHDYEASSRAAMTLLNQGQLVEALRELSRWYGQPVVPAEDEQRLVDLLGQLAGTVIYSRDPWLGPPYQVRVGDTLESIAQQYQIPWQLLAKINGIQNSNGLLPGEKLKIVHGPFQAQLNVRQGWLALFVDGLYAGRFRVETAGPIAKPDGAYPVAKFTADQMGAGNRAPFISLGGDLHLRVPDDTQPPPGVTAVRISRQDMNDVFDMLSERSQVTILR